MPIQSSVISTGEPCEWNHDIRVIQDESPIEVCKAKKRLNILHLLWFQPVLDSLNFGQIHLQTIFQKNEAQVLDRVDRETALVRTGIQTMLTKTEKYFMDVLFVLCQVI